MAVTSSHTLNRAAYGILTVGVVWALYVSHSQTERLRHNICDTLQRSEQGLPSNPYFHDHPDRLKNALEDVRQSQRDLRCKN